MSSRCQEPGKVTENLSKRPDRRADGSQMSCSRNTAVLLSPQQTPLGSRIQGITPYELRMKKHTKLLSLSLANV